MPETGAPSGIIAIVRLRRERAVDEIARALVAGGVGAVEVTIDTPGALEAIGRWRDDGGALVGVGTVRTPDHARRAIDSGAQFLVTPTTVSGVLAVARDAGVPIVPGALSPTEIDAAWQQGAAAVKVFPADALGGPAYVKAVQAPLPDVPLVPTGGVNAENARAYAALGCVGVGVGSALVDEGTVAAAHWDVLTDRASALQAAWSAGLTAR
ncbi:bifunctional 4-hydroxy-2-oxoglutarate aldolase/2-dehydro-3-deoxy-phosphogluconate aldolase [Georgenia alba]|uniref:Bifunctional 4-hydroxy-2-oxoglutarate aldolase/2-dehydro-3-deoxy-phosphogluconate aldolase n=1 Tax=Georgenia alba TaxID=2233858 RepID=A0ABW2Q9L0_9MICO